MELEVLNEKSALITGATGGIGKEIAHELAARGCNLFIPGRDQKLLGQLQADLSNYGVDVYTESVDLTVDEEIRNLIDKVSHCLGNIDILINCAGAFPVKNIFDSSLEDFDSCYAVNIRAPFILTKHFSEAMVNNQWGRIVNIGSSSSYSGFKETSIYCSSKHALLGLSRSLSDELRQHNVRVFCFSPGSVKTEMGRKVKNQDFDTFIEPYEIDKYIAFSISFDDEMIVDEIRMNRVVMR